MKTQKHRVTVLVALAGLFAAGCSLFGAGNTPGISPTPTGKQPVGWIYTTLYNQDAVMEIDKVQSRASKDPILVGAGPRAVAIDPRGRGEYLYVVCERGNAVAIVDRRNRLVNRTVNVGNSPFAIAITPKGERAFVTNAGDDTVSVIDLKTQTVVQTVQLNTSQTNQPGGVAPTKLKPQGVAVNATGTRAYVVCASGQVVVLEGTVTSQYSAARNIVLAGSVSPTNIAVNSTGSDDFVYITDPAANRLFSFNGAQSNQQAEVRDISGGPWGVAVGNNPQTGRADRLYITTSQGNALYPLTLPDLQSATSGGQGLSVEGKEPRGVAVSPIGDEIYVSLAGQNTVAIFTRAGNELSRPEVFQTSQLNTQYVSPTGDLALGGFLTR